MVVSVSDVPCFHPLNGFRAPGGGISFNPKTGYVDQAMAVPCGRCIGCKLERSRQWAVRLLHERTQHEFSCFITLTYADRYLPQGGTLVKAHFQSFMKRLRRQYPIPIRFFHCGEYGENLERPHYHAILFGIDFPDKTIWERDSKLYRSPTLDKLWGMGYCTIGAVTFESAAYVASYCVKKVSGPLAAAHYAGRLPEYVTMSRAGGIGSDWFLKYSSDVYPHDEVITQGRPAKPPRFYDKRLEKSDPKAFSRVKRSRLLEALEPQNQANSNAARLLVREQVTTAKTNLYRGKL